MTTQTVPVTVVIPAFNREPFIRQAVASAMGQLGVRPAQVLVVDDASTDRTAEIAASEGATVITLETNGGGARARAIGVESCTTDWIALLDSDDYWLPTHLSGLWKSRGGHVLVSSSSIAVDADGAAQAYMGPASHDPVRVGSPADLYPTNFISTSGVMMHRESVLEAGGFRTDLKFAEDLDLWLRLLERGTGVVLPYPTTRYRIHAGQKVNDPRAREAQRSLLMSYSNRDWWTARVLNRHLAVRAWDAFRADLRQRQFKSAAVEAAWFARDPRRLEALVHLLRDRRRRRAVGAEVLRQVQG